MIVRHPVFTNVAVITERLNLMTPEAVHLLAASVQPVRIFIIQIVNIASQIVAAMTAHAVGLPDVTGLAPDFVGLGHIPVLMTPVGRMDVLKRYVFTVTESTLAVRFDTAVTTHA